MGNRLDVRHPKNVQGWKDLNKKIKNKMTEQDLIKLGFDKVNITAEESGYPRDWHYYTYDFTRGLSLISCDNEEAGKSGWYVEFFEADDIKFKNTKDLEELIELIYNNKYITLK